MDIESRGCGVQCGVGVAEEVPGKVLNSIPGGRIRLLILNRFSHHDPASKGTVRFYEICPHTEMFSRAKIDIFGNSI